jgi:hypothetical protein
MQLARRAQRRNAAEQWRRSAPTRLMNLEWETVRARAVNMILGRTDRAVVGQSAVRQVGPAPAHRGAWRGRSIDPCLASRVVGDREK